MCSIFGFNFRDENLLKKMAVLTKHRGPDDQGFYFDNDISLGHNRLAIIDLSEKGRQPLWNETKDICVVCNGEIYNFQEIKKNLIKKGHRFFSNSDSEVIVHLYEEKKEQLLDDLDGIFAFAVYNKKNGDIFLARDRFGVKPLYYYFENNKFIFCSEIKGVLAHPIKRELDNEALRLYFTFSFTPTPFTLIKSIKKLPPSHYLFLKRGRMEIKRYWDLEQTKEIKSKEEAILRTKKLFREAVKKQTLSDRPLGVFLSGGVDSTAVLGALTEITSSKIKTYSVGFVLDNQNLWQKFNRDFDFARKTSEFYKTEHHEILVSGSDARDNIEKAVYHMDEPIANATQIPTLLLAELAKKEVAVILGGDGGDELFAGYPRDYLARFVFNFQKYPFPAKNKLLSFLPKDFLSKDNIKEKLLSKNVAELYLNLMGQKPEVLQNIFLPELRSSKEPILNFLKAVGSDKKFKDKTKSFMYLDLFFWLCGESLLRSDKMTMAFGLEQRVPILDYKLAELAFSIPTKFNIKGKKKNKFIFRQAVAEYLPEYIINQTKKGWFSPASGWMRSELKDMFFDVLSKDYFKTNVDILDFKKIRNILDKHISGEGYYLDILWTCFVFQIWRKQFKV